MFIFKGGIVYCLSVHPQPPSLHQVELGWSGWKKYQLYPWMISGYRVFHLVWLVYRYVVKYQKYLLDIRNIFWSTLFINSKSCFPVFFLYPCIHICGCWCDCIRQTHLEFPLSSGLDTLDRMEDQDVPHVFFPLLSVPSRPHKAGQSQKEGYWTSSSILFFSNGILGQCCFPR